MKIVTNPPPLRLIERYSMPTNYIELIKESKYDDEVRDRLLYYVSHNKNIMIEMFNSKFDLFGMAESFKSIENRDSFSLEKEIDKFQYFKQQSYSSEFKITRMLKYPLTFRKCICMISVFVWINEWNPLEVFIFSEPQLTLLTEPWVMANKSVFNNKYSYRQVIDELK